MTTIVASHASLKGWGSGLAGVLIFSGSLPATRLALQDFPPLFLTSARAVIAAILGAGLLLVLRQRRPEPAQLVSLAVVALGVVVGFPLLTALALQSITSAQSIVFIGLLPLVTALFGVVRAGERPKPAFWLCAGFGAVLVAGFAGFSASAMPLRGAGFMLAAITVCGLGYAEGARLSRALGGWQVISWALLLSLPCMLPVAFITLPASLTAISAAGWAGLAYVSLFSMMLGFVFWYRGLALGGIAAVGQLQLLQPFFGFVLAAALLHEQVSGAMLFTALFVVASVAGAKKFA
ncbi:DMT family transporter [Rhizobium paknamense]|uniref:Drug/metabolite transporter (DMT)-like permease n=1 Tax=Rhizobium paknamense TaxID=1206817 RepID=A0ABU0IDG9_9HYPH|nr:DMT family transporter [Rhizobium paknamense]MDQ0455480.1 drug/metabolite transporter (DMT)-like permease [Rhizobium paknamense]